MADRSYDPFNGYSNNGGSHRSDDRDGRRGDDRDRKSGLGQNLQELDWKSMEGRGDWVGNQAKAVVSSEAVQGQGLLLPEEADEWRATHQVSIFGENCPPPMPEFHMLTMLPNFILKKFEAQGFKQPSGIQAQSWPILFQHRDFVGIAKTGSGKTLAFVVPAIAHIAVQQQLRPGDGPIVVVLAPTRELAQQIEEEAKKVLPNTMRCACIFGGAPKGPQIGQLREGVHILVATPGRLIDLLEIRRTNLTRTTYLVLDEADRMLDMGFEPQVRSICSQIRPDRQTIMFSASWPCEIQSLAASFMRDVIRVHIGSTELLANPDVTQHFIRVSEYNKFEELRRLIDTNRERRVLVFCKTKSTADQLERQLRSCGHDSFALHGNKEQRQRDFILDRFRRDGKSNLIATDVAARGLDIKELEIVINYDFPMSIDDYVHRIGRTGRAGNKGDSYTLISQTEPQLNLKTVAELVKILQKAKQDIPEWLMEWSLQYRGGGGGGRGGRGGGGGRFGGGRGGGYGGMGAGMKRSRDDMHYSHGSAPSFNATPVSSHSNTYFNSAPAPGGYPSGGYSAPPGSGRY